MGWFALVILAILFFLVLNNSSGTVAVVNALGGNATALTGALQGRPVSGAGSNNVKLTSDNTLPGSGAGNPYYA